MFKKIYKKLFAKAMQAEREECEAQLEAARLQNKQLRDKLSVSEKAQDDLRQEVYTLGSELTDTRLKLVLAKDEIEQLKDACSAGQQNKIAEARAITFFTVLAQKSIEELRAMPCNFEVTCLFEKWSVVTGHCPHCGSSLAKEFCDERTALLYALLRTALGQSPKDGLCATCHVGHNQGEV